MYSSMVINSTRLIPAHLTLSSSVFLQFQDPGSSTLTYLIGDKDTGDAVIIDPVLERLTMI